MSMVDFSLEDKYDGIVCGLDEVGRGPLAGCVAAACVYVPIEVRELDWMADVRDSKKLSEKKLEALFELISEHCPHGVARVSPQEIDEINILQAALKAMRMSLEAMRSSMESEVAHALVDGNHLPKGLPCPATPVIKGDNISKSIAAASIIAKVTRDREMRELAAQYPGYGWESNVGYPAPVHLEGINKLGITSHHRKSFAPVRRFIETGNTKP